MNGLKIIVATHKPYWMPTDPAYLPVWVGASLRRREDMRAAADGAAWRRDDEGENISAKNPNYCELTGLYWAWKNLGADALGVAHYRRHFKGARGVATGDELVRALEGVDALSGRPVDLEAASERGYVDRSAELPDEIARLGHLKPERRCVRITHVAFPFFRDLFVQYQVYVPRLYREVPQK